MVNATNTAMGLTLTASTVVQNPQRNIQNSFIAGIQSKSSENQRFSSLCRLPAEMRQAIVGHLHGHELLNTLKSCSTLHNDILQSPEAVEKLRLLEQKGWSAITDLNLKNSQLLKLPAELIQNILENLKGFDLLNASNTCTLLQGNTFNSPKAAHHLNRFKTMPNSPYRKRLRIHEAIEELDKKSPLPDTEQARTLVAHFKKATDEELIQVLKPLYDPKLLPKKIAKAMASEITAAIKKQKNQTMLEVDVATREFIRRNLSSDVLTGSACTVM